MRFFVEDGDDTRVVVVVVVVVFFALLFSLRDFFLAMFSKCGIIIRVKGESYLRQPSQKKVEFFACNRKKFLL